MRTVHFIFPENEDDIESNFFSYYESIFTHSNFTSKSYIGIDFTCKFCGTKNRTKFKKGNAHSYPEFTGNQWLFSKDECKDCNSLFSIYENELANHGKVSRTLLGLKTKNGKSTKFKSDAVELQKKNNEFIINVKNQIKELDVEKHGSISFTDGKLTIPVGQYKPLYLLKCLMKIALSILPSSEFTENSFEELKKWLLDKDSQITKEFAFFNYVFHSSIKLNDRKPIVQLYKKKSNLKNYSIPSYSLIFGYGNDLFQIYLPFCENDKVVLSAQNVGIYIMPFLVRQNDKKCLVNYIDGSTEQKVSSGKYSEMKK